MKDNVKYIEAISLDSYLKGKKSEINSEWKHKNCMSITILMDAIDAGDKLLLKRTISHSYFLLSDQIVRHNAVLSI